MSAAYAGPDMMPRCCCTKSAILLGGFQFRQYQLPAGELLLAEFHLVMLCPAF